SSGYLRIIQGFSLVCLGIAVRYIFLIRVEALPVLALITALAGLYALPLLPGRKNFRSLHGVKIYVVALCWSSLTVLFPLVHSKIPLSGDGVVAFVRRFLIVLVLTLPFDIRDLKYDALRLGTIPQQIGVKRTKRLGMLLLLLFYFLLFLRTEYTVEMVVVDGIIVLVTGFLLFFAKKDQSVYYSSVYVESVPIVWLLLLLLAERLF
ncbi:MAG: hypothetical protein KDD04_07845, partial [Sinomicrobium sp.]|nr:hypothetical protein [Sinomicrobium sp.]